MITFVISGKQSGSDGGSSFVKTSKQDTQILKLKSDGTKIEPDESIDGNNDE